MTETLRLISNVNLVFRSLFTNLPQKAFSSPIALDLESDISVYEHRIKRPFQSVMFLSFVLFLYQSNIF